MCYQRNWRQEESHKKRRWTRKRLLHTPPFLTSDPFPFLSPLTPHSLVNLLNQGTARWDSCSSGPSASSSAIPFCACVHLTSGLSLRSPRIPSAISYRSSVLHARRPCVSTVIRSRAALRARVGRVGRACDRPAY